MTQWELLSFTISVLELVSDVSTQLRSELAEPCLAQVSLVELSTVGDIVGTAQFHNQCIGISKDVTVQLRSEVA